MLCAPRRSLREPGEGKCARAGALVPSLARELVAALPAYSAAQHASGAWALAVLRAHTGQPALQVGAARPAPPALGRRLRLTSCSACAALCRSRLAAGWGSGAGCCRRAGWSGGAGRARAHDPRVSSGAGAAQELESALAGRLAAPDTAAVPAWAAAAQTANAFAAHGWQPGGATAACLVAWLDAEAARARPTPRPAPRVGPSVDTLLRAWVALAARAPAGAAAASLPRVVALVRPWRARAAAAAAATKRAALPRLAQGRALRPRRQSDGRLAGGGAARSDGRLAGAARADGRRARRCAGGGVPARVRGGARPRAARGAAGAHGRMQRRGQRGRAA